MFLCKCGSIYRTVISGISAWFLRITTFSVTRHSCVTVNTSYVMTDMHRPVDVSDWIPNNDNIYESHRNWMARAYCSPSSGCSFQTNSLPVHYGRKTRFPRTAASNGVRHDKNSRLSPSFESVWRKFISSSCNKQHFIIGDRHKLIGRNKVWLSVYPL